MAFFRFAGPLCSDGPIDSGTLGRQPAMSLPGGIVPFFSEGCEPGYLLSAGMNLEPPAATDQAEFAIVKWFPAYNHKRQEYAGVRAYLDDRNIYFGSSTEYSGFAAESDLELAEKTWIANNLPDEFANSLQKRQIFYRWVRMAYKRKFGKDVDVPEIIRKGMSKKLADKIAQVRGSIRVRNAHAEQFKKGGFNARPIKFAGHYLLGTLSEHATGLAADINDQENAQLTAQEWHFIEGLVSKKVVRAGRWKTEEAATGLFNDIQQVNDLFVKKVAAEVIRIEKERAASEAAKETASKATGHPARGHKNATPLEEVLGKHSRSLTKWVSTGFFHLPLELVLEFRAAGFTWGATFTSNVDLHHFELPEEPVPARSAASKGQN
jgi:hypothetical protein